MWDVSEEGICRFKGEEKKLNSDLYNIGFYSSILRSLLLHLLTLEAENIEIAELRERGERTSTTGS